MDKEPIDISLRKGRSLNEKIARNLIEELAQEGKYLPERDLSDVGPISLAEYPEPDIIVRVRRQRLLGTRSRDAFTLITDMYLEREWQKTLKELRDKGLIS